MLYLLNEGEGGNTVLAEQVQNAYMAALDGTFAMVYKADAWIKERE